MSSKVIIILTTLFYILVTQCHLINSKVSKDSKCNNINKENKTVTEINKYYNSSDDYVGKDMSLFELTPINNGDIPENFDWREHDAVSPVKDQESCGACWAFSLVGNIESHLKIYLKKEITLSEQFLIDCDISNKGCNSAPLIKSFGDIVTMGGVLQSEDYAPYSGKQQHCKWSGEPPALVPVIGFKRVYPDEDMMAAAIYNYGPLSVAINSASMETYKGNYIDEPSDEKCSPDKLNHAVLIVGYNVYVSGDKRVPYWIIKNSWSTKFGDNGFYYLVRGRNACGIASDVSFAFVK